MRRRLPAQDADSVRKYNSAILIYPLSSATGQSKEQPAVAIQVISSATTRLAQEQLAELWHVEPADHEVFS
jgi:hypothetical protein